MCADSSSMLRAAEIKDERVRLGSRYCSCLNLWRVFMFYISELRGRMHNSFVGVTDTADGVTEYYADNVLVKLIQSKVIPSEIYGIDIYNNTLEATVLHIDKTLDSSELRKRIDAWKRVHNPWTGLPVKYYLAESKVGTVIIVKYTDTTPNGRVFSGTSKITRLSYDKWLFEDDNSTFSGQIGDTSFATSCLESSSVYMRSQSIHIRS